jgi:hypothetical protein
MFGYGACVLHWLDSNVVQAAEVPDRGTPVAAVTTVRLSGVNAECSSARTHGQLAFGVAAIRFAA